MCRPRPSAATMDELVAGLQGAFLTTNVYDPSRPHPRLSQFKEKRLGYGDQESRRKKLLEEQKSRRRDQANYARRIALGDLDDEEEMDEGTGHDEFDGDDSESNTESKKRKKNPYRNQLMLSEWPVDVPADFHQKWLMMVCPVWKRCLIIASKGTTTVHSRTGAFEKRFPSNLPGGNYKVAKNYSILDCIYHEVRRTFFVLDLMCWNSHPVYDSDVQFRQYWLQVKLAETGQQLSRPSRVNPYPFIQVGLFPCTPESLTSVLSSSWPLEVDGLLFIHKEARYIPGRSPLQGWLKPFMVPKILGLPISQDFLNCCPATSA